MARLQEAGQRVASLNRLHRYSIWLLASLPPPIFPSPFWLVLIWIDAIRLVETEVALHFLISGFGNRCSIFLFFLLFGYPEIDML